MSAEGEDAALTDGERRLLAEIDAGDRPYIADYSPALEAALRARGLTLVLICRYGAYAVRRAKGLPAG